MVGRQRTAVDRDGGHAGAAVRIDDTGDGELGVGGDGKRNANQSLVQEKAIRGAARRNGRNVGGVAVGAVVGAEDRVSALGHVEAVLNIPRRDAPTIAGLMTGRATASIGSERLEKWAGDVQRSGGNEGLGNAVLIGEGGEIPLEIVGCGGAAGEDEGDKRN